MPKITNKKKGAGTMTIIEALKNSKSNPELIKKAKELAGQPMTAEERFEQMVSFVRGCSGGDLSTEEIKELSGGKGVDMIFCKE
ncbi:MAG: hypothetical protein ACON41_05460 [Parvibaculales bacterium]